MHKEIELANNVRVLLHHMPHMESAAVGVWVGIGSRNEDKKLCGISHFLEHMIFKGTPTRSTKRIKEEIEGRGGSLNGFTSEEATCYLAKVSGGDIEIALNVLSDMVLHAEISERELERERSVVMQEIKMYRDLPNHHVHDILSGLMWQDHPLGRPIAGSVESVASITRQDIVNYKRNNYISKNMMLVLCGNLKYEAVMHRIKEIFNIRSNAGPGDLLKFTSEQISPRTRVLYKDTEQSRISMGIHTFGGTHKDRYVLSLLHIILGANMSSRLFENIREKKGLAYEISTEIKRYKDTGGFVVNAGMEHRQIKKTVSLILKELRRIREKPVPIRELKRAKEFFKVQLLLALEDTLDHMLWLGAHAISTGNPPDKDKIVEKIESITTGDLRRVASSIFKSKGLNLAIIGPIKDKLRRGIEKELYL